MAAMRIICVHQGFELYGSDRSFIESVTSFRDAWPQADIEVVLPCEGPIVAPLRAIATRVGGNTRCLGCLEGPRLAISAGQISRSA